MFDHLAPLVASGTVSTPVVASYGFEQVAEAIAKAGVSGGKVLFTPKKVIRLQGDLISTATPQHKLWRYRYDRTKSPPNRPCCPTSR